MGLEQKLMTKKEEENHFHFEVATINRRFETVDELQEYVRSLKIENSTIDTVLASEFSMNISEAVERIEELRMLACELNVDIIVAPGCRSVAGSETWKGIKNQLSGVGVVVEETTFPDDRVPDSVGVFIGKSGYLFAFPKNFGNLEMGNCVHCVPGTGIGVTICGEINYIKPEELEEISVLYNPSEEHDDPSVYIRMAQEAKGSLLTRDEVESLLLKDPGMQVYILTEEEYFVHKQAENKSLRDQIGKEQFDKLFGSDPIIGEDETYERRREQFDRIVDEWLLRLQSGEYDSIYVKTAPGLAEALREKRIPVIRSDGMGTSGVLNKFEGMKIDAVESRPESTRISLSI